MFFCREVATKNWGPIADSLGNFCRKIHQRCVAAAKFTWSCHHFNDHNSGHFNCLRRCKKLSEKKASKPWELTYPTWGSSENHLQNAHSEGDMDSFPGGYIYIYNYHMVYINGMTPKKKLFRFSMNVFNIFKNNENSRLVPSRFLKISDVLGKNHKIPDRFWPKNLWQLWLQIINFTGWFLPRKNFSKSNHG